MRKILLAFPVLMAGVLVACDKDEPVDSSDDTAVEADADTDADSDSDTDADSDADSDSDSDADADADADADSDADADPVPTWSDVEPIFSNKCKTCHTTGSSGGLKISGKSSVVNAPSSVSGIDYIEPGSTADSYIWHKLQGTQSSVGGGGGKMPKSGSVSSTEMATIEDWIVGGAK